jgi:hypothetical protein
MKEKPHPLPGQVWKHDGLLLRVDRLVWQNDCSVVFWLNTDRATAVFHLMEEPSYEFVSDGS